MLNGKFFTGLPPKMIDRRGAAPPNRLESHFFWPDDSQVDTAVETRIKRRNSVQLPSNDRPQYERQLSKDQNDVDTKKRFSKEFSQSSIQFFDNLNDDRSTRRRTMLRNAAGAKKTDITEKPTNTKLALPESVVDEAYTTAKKSQAYTSKIQFYDYVNEEQPKNNRNNLRKPKMDMNNKREMELNTKNSPKLQIKRDVRSLSEEKETRKINNREVKTGDRSRESKANNQYDEDAQEISLQSRRSIDRTINTSPRRTLPKTNNNYKQRYSNEREIYREPSTYERRPIAKDNDYITFGNSDEIADYRRESVEPEFYANRKLAQGHFDNSDDIQHRRAEPRRILKNNNRTQYDHRDDYRDEEVTSRMRTVRLQSPPRKHYYQPEEYYEEQPESYHDNDQVRTPTIRGSSERHFEQHNKERIVEVDLPYRSVNNKLNNLSEYYNKRVETPSSPPPEAEATTTTDATQKSQKHLRSSLCFNDGAIIAENDATRSPTSQYPIQRRNVRSSATQRVSVGLPE